jgi:hypothetical protein
VEGRIGPQASSVLVIRAKESEKAGSSLGSDGMKRGVPS